MDSNFDDGKPNDAVSMSEFEKESDSVDSGGKEGSGEKEEGDDKEVSKEDSDSGDDKDEEVNKENRVSGDDVSDVGGDGEEEEVVEQGETSTKLFSTKE